MLPPKRLEVLLSQAVELQQERCTYHVKPGKLTLDDISLLKDHVCTKYVQYLDIQFHIEMIFSYKLILRFIVS